MIRSHVSVGFLVLAFGLAACSEAPEEVVEATEVEQPSETVAETAVDSDEPAANSSRYFVERVGDRVFFAFDKADLSADAQATLFQQAEWLAVNESAMVIVEGHCDERGTREYNLALGERRAEAVKAFLVGAGVDESRIQTVSYGKERPVAVCAEESCWSQNRRGVTVVSGIPAS